LAREGRVHPQLTVAPRGSWHDFPFSGRLSSLTITDARDYIHVSLVIPQPATRWINPDPVPRSDPSWRPFRGPLSLKSRQIALAALKKFFRDLVNAQHLDHNAFAKI
jgi:hypothetical protein